MSDEGQHLRVVYDCMVFLRALIKESGPSVECFELFESGRIDLFIGDALLNEVSDVLTRPMLQKKYPLLTNGRATQLIETLTDKATLIEQVPNLFSYSRDPKDEPYVNLALAAGATYLVSDDNDLLDLMKDNDVGKDFRARFPDLKIVSPLEFIRGIVQSLILI